MPHVLLLQGTLIPVPPCSHRCCQSLTAVKPHPRTGTLKIRTDFLGHVPGDSQPCDTLGKFRTCLWEKSHRQTQWRSQRDRWPQRQCGHCKFVSIVSIAGLLLSGAQLFIFPIFMCIYVGVHACGGVRPMKELILNRPATLISDVSELREHGAKNS